MNINDIEEGNQLYLRIIEAEAPSPKEVTPDTPIGETDVEERSVSVVVKEVQTDTVVVIRDFEFGDRERLAVDPDHLAATWRPPVNDE